jgi:hypothetical protein
VGRLGWGGLSYSVELALIKAVAVNYAFFLGWECVFRCCLIKNLAVEMFMPIFLAAFVIFIRF